MILSSKIPSWLQTFLQVRCDCLFSALQNQEIMQASITGKPFSFIKSVKVYARRKVEKEGRESKVQIALKL